MATSHSPSKNWEATLQLRYHYDSAQAATRLQHCLVAAPLKVQRALYRSDSPQCQTILLHTAGGMVSGDRLEYEIQLEPQSQVYLTTATAGKIYRGLERWSQQAVRLTVETGAQVTWLPEPTILFEQAQYQQAFTIDLGPDTQFKGGEIIRLGRTARGETFQQGHWRSQWKIRQNHQLIWAEQQQIIGSPQLWDDYNGLHHQPILATYLEVGAVTSPERLNTVRQSAAAMIHQGEWGVTATATQGLLLRYRGSSTQEIQQLLQKLVRDT